MNERSDTRNGPNRNWTAASPPAENIGGVVQSVSAINKCAFFFVVPISHPARFVLPKVTYTWTERTREMGDQTRMQETAFRKGIGQKEKRKTAGKSSEEETGEEEREPHEMGEICTGVSGFDTWWLTSR